MKTPTQVKSSIISFLSFKTIFNFEINSLEFKQYGLLKDINEEYFELELSDILQNIIDNLKIGKDNLLFLTDLNSIIIKKSKRYEKFKMDSPNDVDVYLKHHNKEKKENDLLFLLENSDEKIVILDENNKIEFVRVFNLAKKYAEILYQFVDGLIVDFEHIDFYEFDFVNYIKSENHNLELNQESNDDNLKCLINYNKIEVANLFYLFLEEKIFHFSENERENKVKLQKFIQNNFLYKGKQGEVNEIKSINKGFSKVGYSDINAQLEFLKNFRDIVSLRIDKLSNKINIK